MLDLQPAAEAFRDDVLQGMREKPRRLPCKYFYDERGSKLFEQICELDEYYLTRTELQIMRRSAAEMARQIGAGAMLIELGSGSSVKTRLLLEHLPNLAAYVPVDISRDHLLQAAGDLSRDFQQLKVLPVCADFSQRFQLPTLGRAAARRVVYFPGSTIGNFGPSAACELLQRIAELCGSGGGLLIGIDLQKDPRVIEAAYNDAQGVTAEFSLNLLRRINRELQGDFRIERFAHRAVYNVEHGRIEMYLISQTRQSVTIGGETFEIGESEMICTEHSHKYTIDGFARLAASAGFDPQQHWTDDDGRFAVVYFLAHGRQQQFAAGVARQL